METIELESLHEDASFSGDLLIDNTFLLLPKTANVSAEMIKALKFWGFNSVLCDGTISLGGDIGITPVDENEEADEEPKEKIGDNIKKAIEDSKNIKLGNSDQARIEMVQGVYEEYMNYIEQVFTHYATNKEIDQKEIEETVQELCIFIKEHRRYILRVNATIDASKKNFLVIHSMRTTVLALAIALQLHIPLSKMIDLGVTCILHEIGMLRIPPQLYMTSRKLNPNEKAQITKHTLFGYTIVKDLGFSLPIQLGVLEHHEKENGTGYPRKLSSEKISINAKIIAVACSYEAITASRLYKGERTEFEAMVEILKNNEKQYDDTVIRALLYSVSLFPIGAYVYLSNKKVAVVVDTNPDSPKYPIVQSLTEKDEQGFPKTIATDPKGISIVRILTRKEQEDILKIVAERYQAIQEAQEIAAHAPVEPAKTEPAITKPQTAASSETGTKPEDNETVEVDINMFS